MINIKEKELTSDMLKYIMERTKNYTNEKGEFTGEFCFEVKTHSLKDQSYQNVSGYVFGFENDRVRFGTTKDKNSKQVRIRLENILINEDFYVNLD